MPTIKGFTTKKDIIQQLSDAGIEFKLPFSVNTDMEVETDPFNGEKVNGFDDKPVDIVKVKQDAVKPADKELKDKLEQAREFEYLGVV